MIIYKRASKKDFNELIGHLNSVFSVSNGREISLERSYPRVFKENDKEMGCHLTARKDGKICGAAASYPLVYRAGGAELKIRANGNVAVSEDCRGLGIMSEIMNRIDADDRQEGADLCYLHGARARYRRFGFELCGFEYRFVFTRSMLGKGEPEYKLKYVDLRSSHEALKRQAFELNNSQHTGFLWDYDEFTDALSSKLSVPYAVISEDGAFEGYMCVREDEPVINQMCLRSEEMLSHIIRGYMEKSGTDRLNMGLSAYDRLEEQALICCEKYNIVQPANFKIINFKKVTEAFMREKSLHEDMPDGCITVDSEIFGKWSIQKKGKEISVAPFNGDAEIVLPGFSVYTFLFGTVAQKTDNPLVKAWFPLPLYCPYLS
ncbi:MAG: GNAT family N-acetyltransferase [Clostridia bacterium]|nr:GNAT family N-acetyltransferase [Clostridia bacterium]